LSAPASLKPRLLIADHAATRLGIRMALDGLVQVCAEGGNASDAIELAARTRPDLCLVGFELPGGGLVATRGIRDVAPEIPIIILANGADADDLLAAIDAGACGYLPGEAPGPSLARGVAAVLAGEAAIPRSIMIELVRALQAKAAGTSDGLTAREAQVLAMLERGQPTAAIAERLGISQVTVRRHISATMRKRRASDRRALVAGSAQQLRRARPAGPADTRGNGVPARSTGDRVLPSTPESAPVPAPPAQGSSPGSPGLC